MFGGRHFGVGWEMDGTDVSTRLDRWGEPLPSSPGVPERRPGGHWWWPIGAICVVLILAGGFYLVRRSVIQSLSASCREARRAKDWERLEELAERWHWWQRGKAAPLIYLAEAANETKRFERAAEVLERLPDADPMTPLALVERSSILFGPLNRPIEGAASLERAIKLNPKLIEARRRLIYFYAYTLQRRKMVQLAYDTIEHDCDLPETYVYLMLQDALSFSDAYDVNTRWFLGNRDEELFMVARAIYRITTKGLDDTVDPRDGPVDESGIPYHRKVVQEYFTRFPNNLELLAYFLQLSVTAGDVEEAARLLSRAPPEAEADNRFWRYMGWVHTARGELYQAKKCYEKALFLNGYDHLSRHQLAAVERRFKQLDRVKALEELAREGKMLRRQILQLENVARVPPGLLKRMAAYAEKCGDELAAGQLRFRIEQWSEEWSRADPKPSLRRAAAESRRALESDAK